MVKQFQNFIPLPVKTGWAQIEEKAKYSSVEKWHTSDTEESVKWEEIILFSRWIPGPNMLRRRAQIDH